MHVLMHPRSQPQARSGTNATCHLYLQHGPRANGGYQALQRQASERLALTRQVSDLTADSVNFDSAGTPPRRRAQTTDTVSSGARRHMWLETVHVV